MIAILQDVSPNGRFIGLSLLTSTFPLSCMGLIFIPKMLMIRRESHGTAVATRGSRQGIKVSGMEEPSASRKSSNEHEQGNPDMPRTRVQTVTIQ